MIPRGPVWFVTDGRRWWGPWKTLWAASRLCIILQERKEYDDYPARAEGIR